MKCPICGGGHKPVHDDVEQTRIRDAINLTAGAGSIKITPPTGQFWIIDRVTAQVDSGATATLTIYDGDANSANIVSGGVAQAGLGSITGAFNPPVEIGQEGLSLSLTGVATLTACDVGVWYRRRFKVASTPKVDMAFSHTPNPAEAYGGAQAPAERDEIVAPAVAVVDTADRLPEFEDVFPDDEGLYR